MPTQLKGRSTPASVAGKNGYSLISSGKFRQLYATLLKCELLEERLGSSLAHGTKGTPSLMASAVGLTLDLEPEDTVLFTPQIFAANLVKGVPVRTLLCSAAAKESDAVISFARIGALNRASSGESAGLATGAALANKMAKNSKVAVAFMEGGTLALKTCREVLEIASKHKLPVLYVVEAELDRSDEKLLAAFGNLFPVITVDAYDLVAIYRVAQESIARARDGGPTLIACLPYVPDGMSSSAIVNIERYLVGKKLFENSWKDEALAEFNTELGAACLPQSDPLA